MYQLPSTPTKKAPKPAYRKPEAVKILEAMADAEAHRLHPSIDPRYLAPRTYRDDSANALTKCIVDYVRIKGGFASRINSTGIYDKRLGKYRTGTQKRGIADIWATHKGKSLQIEVKAGKDRQSDEQRKVETEQTAAGGLYFIAHDFTSFKQWFDKI